MVLDLVFCGRVNVSVEISNRLKFWALEPICGIRIRTRADPDIFWWIVWVWWRQGHLSPWRIYISCLLVWLQMSSGSFWDWVQGLCLVIHRSQKVQIQPERRWTFEASRSRLSTWLVSACSVRSCCPSVASINRTNHEKISLSLFLLLLACPSC